MEIATETERKYDVADGFELPALDGAAEPRSHDLDATYFDTDDLRLARNRRTLRRRTGGDDAGWHLKTPGDGTSRTEHRLPLTSEATPDSDAMLDGAVPDGAAVPDDEAIPDGEAVPDELQAEVRAIIRERALRPVARLRTRRIETPLRDAGGRTLALVAQDQVTAETDIGRQIWQEVEVELVAGGPGLLEAVERALLAAGATPAAGPSKLARALADRLPAGRGKTKQINPVLRYAREQRDAISAYDPGVRHGDPEAVHKMRVATRRLRSTLKTFRRSFPAALATRVGPELKWLAGQLGEVRDGQVLSDKLIASVAAEGDRFAPVADRIQGYLDAKVAAGREALAGDLNGGRYLGLLDAIDELVADPDTAEKDPLRRARKALYAADDLLDRAVADGVDAELHEARKAYKRARYAVEVFVPPVGRPAKQLTKALTDLQEVLGAHQDSVVAREILRELAGAAEDGFPYGILYARQEQIGRDTFGDLPAAIEAAAKTQFRSWID
jgi:CHAD domain-containing protein